MPILGIKDVNVSEAVGGDCWFPLISHREADAVLF
jgi:hypothetical protein